MSIPTPNPIIESLSSFSQSFWLTTLPTLLSLGVTIYNLAFWLSDTGPADTLLHFTSASASARAAILKKYKAAGIKVLVSAFGSTDRPQTNLNATAAAASLAKLVLDYNLDGVDIDYEQVSEGKECEGQGSLS